MSDSVGKISLDLEVKSDIERQIGAISNTISKNLKASIEGSTKNLFSGMKNNMEKSLGVVNNSMKGSLSKMKSNIKNALNGAFATVKNISLPRVQFPKVSSTTPKENMVPNPTQPRAPPIPKVNNNMDMEVLKSQIDNLTRSLDITNSQIENQQEKLKRLKESYNNTFNQGRKNKIQEQILRTEATINRLTATSDKAGFKLNDLDSKFAAVKNSAKGATSGVNALNRSLNNTGNSTNKTKSGAKSLNNSIKSTGRSFNNSRNQMGMFFSSMFKWGLIFPMIIGGIRAIGKSLGQSLMTNQQFANSLAQIKTNLMVAFMPIYQAALPAINALMSALSTITAYIASFTSALFGKTYQQSFNAAKGLVAAKDAMGAYGKEAKKTGKEAKDALGLAGFDEINNLNKNKEADEGGGGGSNAPNLVAPNMNMGAVDKSTKAWVDKFKKLLSQIFQPFKNAWAKEGQSTITSMKYALNSILELIKSIGKSFLTVWTNGTGEAILVVILQILQNIFNIIGDIATTFANAWNSGDIGTHIVQTLADAFIDVLTLIKHIGDSFREVWGEVGPGVANTFMKVLDATSGVLKNLTKNLLYVWDNGGSHLFKGFIKLGAKVFELAGYIYTKFVVPLVDWFVNNIAPVIAKVADVVGTILDAFSDLIDWLLGSGKPALDIMIKTVTLFFTAWKVTKLVSFIQQAGGAIGALGKLGLALKACTVAKIADKVETMKLTAMYAKDFVLSLAQGTKELIKQAAQIAINIKAKIADKAETVAIAALYAKDFVVSVAKGTAELIKQAAQFVIIKGAKIADTIAQVALTAATVAWNIVCGIATIATTALGAAFTFLTSPIGLVILAIAAIIAIGVLLYKHWDEIKAKAIEVWDSIKQKFDEFNKWLEGIFNVDWSKNFGFCGEILNSFLATIKNIWDSIKRIFGGIIDFVAGVFTGDWRRAWQGVKDIFGGIMDGLGAVIKAPLNAVIGLINGAIGAINSSVSLDIPDWVPKFGGRSFGVNIPKIPYLAKGGIIDSPTLSMVGEAGKEAVVPLENNTQGLDLLASKLMERLGGLGSTGNSNNSDKALEIVLELGGSEFARFIIDSINKLQRQEGRTLLKV